MVIHIYFIIKDRLEVFWDKFPILSIIIQCLTILNESNIFTIRALILSSIKKKENTYLYWAKNDDVKKQHQELTYLVIRANVFLTPRVCVCMMQVKWHACN